MSTEQPTSSTPQHPAIRATFDMTASAADAAAVRRFTTEPGQ